MGVFGFGLARSWFRFPAVVVVMSKFPWRNGRQPPQCFEPVVSGEPVGAYRNWMGRQIPRRLKYAKKPSPSIMPANVDGSGTGTN